MGPVELQAGAEQHMPKKKTNSSTMPQQTDALSGEVAIRAHLDDKGLTVAGKSRALAALDRLFGGVIGIPAEYFEGVRRRAELRGEAREQFIKSQTLQHANSLPTLEQVSQVATQRFIAEEIRKQINREGVIIASVKALQDAPEPIVTDHEQFSEALEEDWINVFASFAEKASSERLQQLWGRILSGEIRKPGSFALSTLRIISELDAEIAATFQELVAHRIDPGFILKPDKLSGEILVKWTTLEEAGLLQEVNGTLGYDRVVEDATYDKPKRVLHARAKDYGVVLTFVRSVPPFRLSVVKITRVGQQISSILPWDEIGALRAIAAGIEQDVGVDIVHIDSINTTEFRYRVVENIKPTPTVPNIPTSADEGKSA